MVLQHHSSGVIWALNRRGRRSPLSFPTSDSGGRLFSSVGWEPRGVSGVGQVSAISVSLLFTWTNADRELLIRSSRLGKPSKPSHWAYKASFLP